MSKFRERKALCAKDAAGELGMHVDTLRRYVRQGLIVVERNPGARGRAEVLLERSALSRKWRLVTRR